MDTARIISEVRAAASYFAFVEAHPTNDGNVYVKAVLQTSVSRTYFIAIYFAGYPYAMPAVYVTNPKLQPTGDNHMFRQGNICYLHPNMWNPGRHTLTFVLERTAKWLNKYEVWSELGRWPGAQVRH